MWKSGISTGLGFTDKAVWSRASRRHIEKLEREDTQIMEDDMNFGFKVKVESESGGRIGSKVTMRWMKGHDSVLFESFCGMLKRKVEED